MNHQFDPRTMLKQSSLPLLHQFFEQRRELLDLPWEELKAHRRFDLIYHAWQALPDTQRRQVQAIFQDLWELADDRGLRSFVEELQAASPHTCWEFTACRTKLNKVLWMYIYHPKLLEKAALFVRADGLSRSRYAVRRNSLPKQPITVTPEVLNALAAALRDYYWSNEMRGRHCQVEHYTRSGGNEYFFAYLDDWPDSRLVVEDDGQLESVSQRYAFSVLFVFCPEDGSLELVAKGTKEIHYPLQQAFAQAVFGIDIAPADPSSTEYDLNPLLDDDFSFPTETQDCIARVRLSRIRIKPKRNALRETTVELRFSSRIARRQWLEEIHSHIHALGLTRHQVEVEYASFQLKFASGGIGRSKSLTFSVNLPSSCDLKTKPDEMRDVGVRCLQKWGIVA